MTLSEIITQARSILGEMDASNSHFADSGITTWANEAIRYIVTRIENLPIKWTDLTAATGNISIDADTLNINEAYLYNPTTTKYEPLEVCEYGDLKYLSPTWLSTSAGKPTHFARKDDNEMYLYPQPDSTYMGQTIQTAGVEMPTPLSNSSDVPTLPVSLHDLIPHYIAYRGFEQLQDGNRAGNELMLVREMIKSLKSAPSIWCGSGL